MPGLRFGAMSIGSEATGDHASADLTAEALLDRYGDRLYRFCLRLCNGNVANAEDLVQDVLLLGWRSRDAFEGRSSALTYLFRIAVNRWGRVRSQGAAAELRERSSAANGSTVAADHAEGAAVRLDIERALAQLPDPLRTAFLVVKAEGLTYREAARLLDLPQGTVQSRVHEAAQRLRALLSDETAGRTTDANPTMSSDDSPDTSIVLAQKENCHAM